MKIDHSPEITVLLMACTLELSTEKKTQLIQFLAGHQVNWDRLYVLAARHRITPFLYRTLYQIPAIPESFLSILKTDCRAIATDNLLKLHQYQQLAKRLTDNAIAHISFKGVYLAANCYPDSSLRIIGDLDVLVGKADVLESVRLLEADEYHLSQKFDLYRQYGVKNMLRDLYEVSLIKPFFNKSYFEVDLHWEITCFNKQYKSFDLREILSRPASSIELQIVLVVTHHGVTNIWQTINYINDLYFLVRNKEVDWRWLLEELRRYGLEKVLLVGLYWCQQIWQLPLPSSIQLVLTTNTIRSLAEAYEKNWETTELISSSNLIVSQLTFFLKAQTQFSKQLKVIVSFCSSRIFRFSTFRIGSHVLYVPRQLGFITVVVRAFRSLLHFAPAFRR